MGATAAAAPVVVSGTKGCAASAIACEPATSRGPRGIQLYPPLEHCAMPHSHSLFEYVQKNDDRVGIAARLQHALLFSLICNGFDHIPFSAMIGYRSATGDGDSRL